MIDKMSASQRAALLIERLGEVAINMEAERVYHYSGSLWEPLTDNELRREMAAIFTEHSAPFSDKGVGAAVSTMKLMIPALGQPAADLIGFANGVYDMAARRFRPHSPSDGLLNHNGINYVQPLHGECIEHHAPSFTKWLNHAAEGDAGKMERINAALRFVVRMLASSPADARLYMESAGFPRLRARQQQVVRDVTERMAVAGMPFTGRPKRSVDRVLATRALVTATTELITGWLHGDIDTDEDTLVATITAVSLGAARSI